MSPWRRKLEGILRDYGHNVLLQRRIEHHGDGQYSTRDNHGYSKTLERHTVRSRLAGKSTSIPNVVDEFFEGIVSDVDQLFYFKWDVKPDKFDRIYEREPSGIEIFRISWAHPFRGPNGEVIYWAAGANMEHRDDA